VEQGKVDQARETLLKEYEQAKDMFTLVVNSDGESSLKKKASQQLSELEQPEEIK
jgi:hypothetical protein